jgi:flagellar biogenesis protein FliO
MEKSSAPQSSGETPSLAESLLARIRSMFSSVRIERRTRRLKLCETLSLGDKRLIALVECENRRFLIAATGQNISLLETLTVPDAPDVSGGRGENSKS